MGLPVAEILATRSDNDCEAESGLLPVFTAQAGIYPQADPGYRWEDDRMPACAGMAAFQVDSRS